MHGLRELEYPYGCHWSDEIQKTKTSFSESPAPAFLRPLFAIQALLLTSQTLY